MRENSWRLKDVVQTRFENAHTSVAHTDEQDWHSVLTPSILSVLLVPPERMPLWTLFSYVQHLRENRQESTRYEIALWNKIIYPFAVLVMMVLALPFAYMNVREAGSAQFFRWHHAGAGFHLLNRLFNVGSAAWPPVLAAFVPTVTFLAMAIFMMEAERRLLWRKMAL